MSSPLSISTLCDRCVRIINLALLDSRMWETSLFQRLPFQGMFGIEVPLDPL
jgi:hypothetical protein